MAAGQIAGQVQRFPSGPEHTAQDRVERLSLDIATELGGDRLGRCIGLLGCDPALLDGEGRDVAGGEHVAHPPHPSVVVDRDEPVGIVRDTAELPPLDLGKAEHGVGLDRLAG